MPANDDNQHKKRLLQLKKLVTSINFNIGTFIFGALFLYMFVSVIIYVTAGHITSYQVVAGPLAKNQTYTALILRNEQVFQTNSSGFVNYYARENARIKKNGVVYTIGSTKSEDLPVSLDDTSLSKIRSTIANFSNNFNSLNYNSTYSFKYELEGTILQYGTTSSNTLESNSTDSNTASQTACTSSIDGVVLYSVDGYESLEPEDITTEHFNQRTYHNENLKSSDQVQAGSNIYKIIPDESWSLIVPITNAEMAQLAALTSVKVKFLKDGSTQVGKFTILFQNDEKFAKIDFNSGMIRYSSDRFIDIELVTNTKSGLKIPASSIVTKELYTIPTKYQISGSNQSGTGFARETTDKNGKTITEFVKTTIYKIDTEAGLCYVEKSDFKPGDKLILDSSNERYTIKDTATIEGVYSINKGYAVFRQTNIIDQDEEYCIVAKGQDYSIAQYDYIVLDGSTVKEKDILY